MILVINADDAGIDSARNRGILRAACEGIARSATLLVGFTAAADFVDRARLVPGLGIGLHLNLTGGRPLVAGHRSLVGEDGAFPEKREVWRRAFAGLLDEREVRREIEAQWGAMERLGVRPTHLDGHNHVHLFPGVREAVVAAIPEGTWVRLPRPAAIPEGSPGSDPRSGATPERFGDLPADLFDPPERLSAVLGTLAQAALDRGWGRFRSAVRFDGPSLPRGYGAADLIALLAALERGSGEDDVVEVMTHPGETCADSVPYSASPDRRQELAALTSPEALAFIRDRGVRLSNYGELGPNPGKLRPNGEKLGSSHEEPR
jgi:predicted glycoside hydrolase/deacetylase ChbG (UPF0249 family)